MTDTRPTNWHSDHLYPADADREAVQGWSTIRVELLNGATIALIRCTAGRSESGHDFRIVTLTDAETAEAETIPYTIEDGEGIEVIANRHLAPGETLVAVL